MVHVQPLTRADMSRVTKMVNENVPFTTEAFGKRYYPMISPQNHYGVYNGSVLVGMIIVNHETGSYYMELICFVFEKHARQGFMFLGMEQMVKKCFADGANIIGAAIRTNNIASKRLFAKLGFLDTGKISYLSLRDIGKKRHTFWVRCISWQDETGYLKHREAIKKHLLLEHVMMQEAESDTPTPLRVSSLT